MYDKWNPPEPQYAKDMREMKVKMGKAPDMITDNIFNKDNKNGHGTKKANKNRKS